MKIFKQVVIPIIITGIWINISETIRWIFLIEPYWAEQYQKLNITFPNEKINLIVWMIWGFLFGITIFVLSKKYNLFQTTIFSWFVAFAMMWLIVWNIGVLPIRMLWLNIPLSLLETFIGAYICKSYLNLESN
ncbi:MAG: hypothetical protein QNK20_15220 [Aureibaculum sp.]|nr:hypothetical protein [Aureibaculum sp.]